MLSDNDAIVLAELYVRLLNDANCLVQQQAHETFLHLSQTSENQQLITKLVLKMKNVNFEVSKRIQAYLSSQVIHRLCGFDNINEYYETLCNANEEWKHVCYKRIPWEGREEKVQRLNGQEDMMEIESRDGEVEDLDVRVDRICAEMEIIVKNKMHLKQESIDRLKLVFQNFLEQVEK